MICTSGQMKTASLLVIDMLAKANVEMYYSSDLDPEGIRMADRLCQRHPDCIRPWRMTPQLQAASSCLKKDQLAGYQEKLIPLMLEDIGNLTSLKENGEKK